MTARQQHRLEQKLARKAAKRAFKTKAVGLDTPTEPANAQAIAMEMTPEPRSMMNDARTTESSTTQAKLAANRANAQRSTGPITETGRAIVSQNATKHGLTANFKVLPSESQSEFDGLTAALLRSEAPAGDDEIEMVHQMAAALWLSRRCVRLQNDCFTVLESGTADERRAAHKSIALYMRYQTTQDRTFSRYSTELRKRRNERARAERGFVSQKHKEAADRRRQELHQVRQALQNARQESLEIRNRFAAAKAEALELKNLSRKTQRASENAQHGLAMAA